MSRARAALGAVLVTTTVVSTTSLAVLVARPAAADQVASLQAQAKMIAQELIREQLQIGADQQQYSVASAKVAADAAAMARIDRTIDNDDTRISRDTDAVRRLALDAYMDAGTDLSGTDAIFSGNLERASLINEYRSLSAGNIDNAIDSLHSARVALDAQHAALSQEQARDVTEQSARATDLDQATGTEQQMQSEQAQVTGQLAAAVAAQAAAQQAAAEAAVAAAQRAAEAAAARQAAEQAAQQAAEQAAAQTTQAAQLAATPPVTAPPAGGGASAAGSTNVGQSLPDPPLPPYLQCVVQAESGGNYQAVSPNGMYMGAFQFSQSTWNIAAQDAGLPFLIGVPPNDASKAAQDTVAIALYTLDGQQPWLGDRC